MIIGLINNWAANKLKNESEDKKKNAYYNALKDVAESLQAMTPAQKEYGIDEIYANQSSLSLEQNLHKLFQYASELADKKILVIRIDDVDMAFKHGFQVLETLRKYLASPYILPVVSGDIELYRKMVEKEFSKSMISPIFTPDRDVEFGEKISDISEKYIIKIMPFDRQIHLKGVSDIIPAKSILIKLRHDDKIPCSYQKIIRYEDEFLNHGINRSEYKNNYLNFDSVRLWLQYLEKMRDWYIKYDDFNKASKENEDNIWFELYKDFQTRINEFTDLLKEKAYLSIVTKSNIQSITSNGFDHNKLLYSDFFNPDNNKFYKIKEEGDFDDRTFKGWHFIAKSQFDLESKSDRAEKNLLEKYEPIERFLLGLFTFDNYYSRSHQTWMFLFAGKFIEFIFSSLNPILLI